MDSNWRAERQERREEERKKRLNKSLREKVMIMEVSRNIIGDGLDDLGRLMAMYV